MAQGQQCGVCSVVLRYFLPASCSLGGSAPAVILIYAGLLPERLCRICRRCRPTNGMATGRGMAGEGFALNRSPDDGCKSAPRSHPSSGGAQALMRWASVDLAWQSRTCRSVVARARATNCVQPGLGSCGTRERCCRCPLGTLDEPAHRLIADVRWATHLDGRHHPTPATSRRWPVLAAPPAPPPAHRSSDGLTSADLCRAISW